MHTDSDRDDIDQYDDDDDAIWEDANDIAEVEEDATTPTGKSFLTNENDTCSSSAVLLQHPDTRRGKKKMVKRKRHTLRHQHAARQAHKHTLGKNTWLDLFATPSPPR